MTPIRLAGSVVSLITGVWTAVLSQEGLDFRIGTTNYFHRGLSGALLTLGVILSVLAIITIVGPRLFFVLASILCVTILSLLFFFWARMMPDYRIAAAVITVLALAVDVLASAKARELSEKDSPLNLPIFG